MGTPEPSGQKNLKGHSAGNVEFPGQSDPAGHRGHFSTPWVGLDVPAGQPCGTADPMGHWVDEGQA